MKLLLTTFFAALLTTPFALAEGGKCDKCPSKEKQKTSLVPCDNCDKHSKKDKKESTLVTAETEALAGKCCKDKNKEECKKEEATLAGKDCGKGKGDCGKGKGDCDKGEATLLAGKDCGKKGKGDCNKDEATLA